MSTVTPEKLTEIASLLERTSPEMAARLLVMFERMKVKGAAAIPAQDLLKAVRDSGMIDQTDHVHRTPGFDRLFWNPFEALLEVPQAGKILPGSLPRQGLAECWAIITRDIVPLQFKAHDPDVRLASLRGDEAAAEAQVAGFRAELLQVLETGGAAQLLADRLECQPVGALVHDLLRADAALQGLKMPLMTSLGDLCPQACSEVASRMIELEGISEHAAALLMLLLMTRLKRPQQVFRVIRNASHSVTDKKLAATEFAVLGERLLGLGRRYLAVVELAALGRDVFDATEVSECAGALADLATGLEREEILEAQGPWRQELLSIKKTLGERGTSICQRAAQLAQQALPLDRVKVKGAGMLDCPRWHGAIDAKRLDLLVAHAGFVSQVKLRASLAGFSSAREKAERELRIHVDTIGNALLALRSKPDPDLAAADVAAWQAAMVQVKGALDGQEAATLFARRLAA